VYVQKDAVICPEITLLGAYMDGHRAGGEAEGHRAVRDLFVHPRGDCVRTIGRDRVHVLDEAVSPNKLVKIRWIEGMPPYMAESSNLDN
jgi:hypothetical protein